jgi:hypothetical protein
MLTETWPFREKDGNCHILANNCWELFLKAVGQPLGTAKRVKENRWEMHRGYWKDSGQFLKDIGQPPGNARISNICQ